jgi:hypothetical protein
VIQPSIKTHHAEGILLETRLLLRVPKVRNVVVSVLSRRFPLGSEIDCVVGSNGFILAELVLLMSD